jgi:hypothetical protein
LRSLTASALCRFKNESVARTDDMEDDVCQRRRQEEHRERRADPLAA